METSDDPGHFGQGDKSQEDEISKILERDDVLKRNLHEIYDEVKRFLSTNPDEILEGEIAAHYKNYKTSLENLPKELMGTERPIIVTGETSAGKSSLLNLLLDFDILPTSTLASTAVICRLRTSKLKKAEIFDNSGNCKTIQMENNDEKAFKQQLKEYISPKKKREGHSIQYVDIYWPIPFLRKNIIVVDTPGVGESEEMTERLKEYLPNAIALIFIIDPSRGGGIQEDRIVPLLKAFHDQDTDSETKCSFDPTCAIFVANKWDLVDDDEVDTVKDYLIASLAKHWPNPQKEQMYYISTKKALKKKKNNKELPDSYLKLRRGIEGLVEVSLGAKSRQHVNWLDKFLSTILYSMQSHIITSRLNDNQKIAYLKKGRKLVEKLEHFQETDKETLKQEAQEQCSKLANKVYNYLHDESNWDDMFPWESVKVPDTGVDLPTIKSAAFGIIESLVSKAFNKSLHLYGGEKIMSDMLQKVKEKTEVIRKVRGGLEKLLQDPESVEDDESESEEDDEENPTHKDTVSKGTVAVIAILSPVWFPLALVGGLIGVPVAAAIVSIKDKFQVSKYKSNKVKYLSKWSKKYIEGNTEEMVCMWVEKAVFSTFYKKLNELFDEELPQTINGSKKLFENLQNDVRGGDSIRERYEPKVAECEGLLAKLKDISVA